MTPFSLETAKEMLLNSNVVKVLDFDNTIADLSHLHRQSYGRVISKRLGREYTITPQFGAQKLRGKNQGDVFRILFSEHGEVNPGEQVITACISDRRVALADLLEMEKDTSLYLVPGIDEVFRLLRRTSQFIGIASQSPESFIEQCLTKSFIDGEPIKTVVNPLAIIGEGKVDQIQQSLRQSGVSAPTLFKPNPFPVVHAASFLSGNLNRQVLYLGDQLEDIKTVVNGGESIFGIIANKSKYEQFARDYKGCPNLLILKSFEEVGI